MTSCLCGMSLYKSAWSRVLELSQIFSEGEWWLKRRLRGESKRGNHNHKLFTSQEFCGLWFLGSGGQLRQQRRKWTKEKCPHYLFLYSLPFLNLHKKKNRTQTGGQSWLVSACLATSTDASTNNMNEQQKTWVHIVQYYVYSISYLFFKWFFVVLLSFGCCGKELSPFAGQ